MDDYDFYHKTDARKHGVAVITGISIFACVCVSLLYCLRRFFDVEIEGPGLAFAVMLGVVYSIFLAVSLRRIIRGGQWLYAIKYGALHMETPSESEGGCHDLEVSEIAEVYSEVHGKAMGRTTSAPSSTRHYLITSDRRKIRISNNSDLNLSEFFAKIKELNPSVKETSNLDGPSKKSRRPRRRR